LGLENVDLQQVVQTRVFFLFTYDFGLSGNAGHNEGCQKGRKDHRKSRTRIWDFGEQKIVCLHTPSHTPGSICIYMDKDGKRILFGQDLHGPLLEEFGSNIEDYGRSTKKLLDLDADILCEGHFGIYKTKKDVRDYILSYRRQYGVE
jgi:glyoxylase-like metal-dependent hydrolase (beta-lactamase superfamily II)